MNPTGPPEACRKKPKLKEIFKKVSHDHKNLQKESKDMCEVCRAHLDSSLETVKLVDVIATVQEWVEVLAAQEKLVQLSVQMKEEFREVFEPIPHVKELLADVLCSIKLKNVNKTIVTQTYSSPWKYRNAWSMLIQQHLDAGRIQPSNSTHASPGFLIPKADKTELP
jgi:hypothetical protein